MLRMEKAGPGGSGWFRVVPGWFLTGFYVRNHPGSCRVVPGGSGWFRVVPGGSVLFIIIDFVYSLFIYY